MAELDERISVNNCDEEQSADDSRAAAAIVNGNINKDQAADSTTTTTTDTTDLSVTQKSQQQQQQQQLKNVVKQSEEEIDEKNNSAKSTDAVDALHIPTLATVPEQAEEEGEEAKKNVVEESRNKDVLSSISEKSTGDSNNLVDDDQVVTAIDNHLDINSSGSLEQTKSSVAANTIEEVTMTTEDPVSANDADDQDDPMGDDDSNDDDNDEVQFIPQVQEVHAISDDSDDEIVIPSKPEEIEHMEVDGGEGGVVHIQENGATTTKTKTTTNNHETAASLETVTSLGKTTTTPPAKQNGTAKPIDDEDEDDCVVIEDDDDDDMQDLISHLNGRTRKHDTISEQDPLAQPSAKRQKTGQNSSNITIQDVQTTPVDPLENATNPVPPQITAIDSVALHHKVPATIKIVDANSIINRSNAETVAALQNQNISVRTVTASGAHQAAPSSTVYHPTNSKASITLVTTTNNQQQLNSNSSTQIQSIPAAPVLLTNEPLLPALTDDMFVLEAPSFIVPYIYEKPPSDNLRSIVDNIRKELNEQKKQKDVDDAEKEAKALEAMSEEQRKLAELAKAADANNKKNTSKRRAKKKNGDDSWGESDTSTDDETSDTEEQRTKVLIKEADSDLNAIKIATASGGTAGGVDSNKSDNYFESPLGMFFIDIAVNLVQEHVQTDLLRQQKRKLRREGDSAAASVTMAINSLSKNLEHSKEKNKIYKFSWKRCEFCNFKSESALVMAHHYEAPHLNGQMYKCNFCPFEVRPPYDILFHMEAMHNTKARLEKALTYHQCANCPFEDNGKSKLARHVVFCLKKFRPETNLNPPLDWESPAKIPRIKPRHGLVGTATAYQAMAAQAQRTANAAMLQRQQQQQQQQQQITSTPTRGRGRPPSINSNMRNTITPQQLQQLQQQHQLQQQQSALNNMQGSAAAGFQIMTPTGQFQIPGNKSSKQQQQSSISITPLPSSRQSPASNAAALANMQAIAAVSNVTHIKPGQHPTSTAAGKFVICEICDGYIKDLDMLRHHMQWIHKVKIHPKMIYNRPPLNCQKCQFRFFTDQGLERHLLGSHGLVTSSMQEAANKSKDSGRCPICGRFLQSKLLNHVSRDHSMTLKPAHLSYKCTVCTATFGMYKQFENHVYSAHSNVSSSSSKTSSTSTKDSKSSKGSQASAASTTTNNGNNNTSKSTTASTTTTTANNQQQPPLRINDEITIIPQPAPQRQTRGGGGGSGVPKGTTSASSSSNNIDSNVIEIL